MLNLETHKLALAIAKKTLDKNRCKTAQKTMAWEKPAFQVGDCVYFKNKQPGKWDLQWRPRYRIVCIEHGGHFLHIENQATGKIQSCNVSDVILVPPIEFWNVDTQFSRAGRYINHPTNLPTIKLRYKKKPTVNNHHISPLQHSILAYCHHKLVRKGTERIIYFPASPTGIPNTSLLDHNSTCFSRTSGMSLEGF